MLSDECEFLQKEVLLKEVLLEEAPLEEVQLISLVTDLHSMFRSVSIKVLVKEVLLEDLL